MAVSLSAPLLKAVPVSLSSLICPHFHADSLPFSTETGSDAALRVSHRKKPSLTTVLRCLLELLN